MGFLPKLGHAEKDVTQYSALELAEFKRVFAQRKKDRPWVGTACYIAMVPIAFVIMQTAPTVAAKLTGVKSDGSFFFGFLVIGALLICIQWLLTSRCPACSAHVEHTIGPFCPCCGSRSLIDIGPHPTCSTCLTTLKWDPWIKSHPKEFKVHACSVCGVWLQDKDV